MSLRRYMSAFLVFGLLAAACDAGPRTVAPSQDASTTTATTAVTTTADAGDPDREARNWWRNDRTAPSSLREESGAFIEWATSALDSLLWAADVVVEGTVEEVDGPYWNSMSGQSSVVDADGTQRRRLLYREVALSVDNLVYDELGLGGHSTIRVVVPDLSRRFS